MPFLYAGDDTRTYPQYRDLATSVTLVANPGLIYDMVPAGGKPYAIPPNDGRWQAVRAKPPAPAAAATPPAGAA